MDVREWEQSQSRRSSIKRPWEEDATLPHQGNTWTGSILPPIGAVPYRRPSLHQATEQFESPVGAQRYQLGEREPIAKKGRYEGDDYKPPARDDLRINTEGLQSRPLSYSPYPPLHRASLDLTNFPQRHRAERWERQGGDVSGPASVLSTNSSAVCPQCRRLTRQQHDLDVLDPSEESSGNKSQESLLVAQSAAKELTKALNTLSSVVSSARRDSIRAQGFEQLELESPDSPPIAQLNLKQSLEWMLGRLYLVNELADKLVQHVSSGSSPRQLDNKSPSHGSNLQDGIQYSMKRHLDADQGEPFRSRGDGERSEPRLHTRRKSLATIPSDDLSQSQNEYPSMHSSSSDGPSRRASIMNPPPAPSRQLPSPPGRSLPSPTSINFPSPSAASYGSSSHSGPPQSIQSSSSNYLPPLNSSSTSESALQAHSAALQHEVSVQKIALSSLQGEHDKLLAAFSRSQLRASALEKKHAVSDNEIISLSEEKLRLQTQVSELEKEVEDLSRSREESRQTAVQDGAQYVELVKNASRLEEMALEERKRWQRKERELEQLIDALKNTGSQVQPSSSANDNISVPSPLEATSAPPTSVEVAIPAIHPPLLPQQDVKLESSNESRSVTLPPTSNPSTLLVHQHHEETKDLKEEIRRLRSRCAVVEDTLRAVREESRSFQGIVQALELTGKSILEKANKTLEAATGE